MNDMNICICGYYYRPEFFSTIKQIHPRYPAHVVSNKSWGDRGVPVEIPVTYRENIGLEWGAYNYYLHHIWDEESPVLFLHDDIRFRPVIKDYAFVEPIQIFNSINKLNHDQVYLFGSVKKAEINYFIHGRALKCSARFLKRLMDNGGFPFDENNTGHIKGPTPKHCKHYNYGDYKFADFIKSINGNGWKIGSYVILPALECATRGRFDNEIEGAIKE